MEQTKSPQFESALHEATMAVQREAPMLQFDAAQRVARAVLASFTALDPYSKPREQGDPPCLHCALAVTMNAFMALHPTVHVCPKAALQDIACFGVDVAITSNIDDLKPTEALNYLAAAIQHHANDPVRLSVIIKREGTDGLERKAPETRP